MKKVRPLARTSGLILQQQQDECLLYDLENNTAYCLNETSAFVWTQCNGKNSISDIRVLVESRFPGKVTVEFIDLSLNLLLKHNLLENAEEVKNNLSGMGRRELLRKVAFGSAIALPLITTVIAPTAVSAQSGVEGYCSSGFAPCSPIGAPCDGIPDACDTGIGTCMFTATPCTTSADCPPIGGTCMA
ncbi:MAG: PqqD family protein [Pyrinomonadaceae bacterium]